MDLKSRHFKSLNLNQIQIQIHVSKCNLTHYVETKLWANQWWTENRKGSVHMKSYIFYQN